MASAPDGIKIMLDGTYEGPDGVLKSGTTVQALVPAEQFGDAEAEHVVQGTTFTSASGFQVAGSFAPQTAEVTPSSAEQTVTPSKSHYLEKVTVKPIPYKEVTDSNGGITVYTGEIPEGV